MRRDERRQFGLLRAFGLSIAIHLLLVSLLSLFVPLITETEAVSELEEPAQITFSLIDPAALAEQDMPPKVQIPLPAEPIAVEPKPAEPPPDEEPSIDLPPEHAKEPLDAAAEERASAARPLEEDDAAPPARPAADAAEATEPRDVSQALRDFGEAIQHRPPGAAPSSGEEHNVIVPDLSAGPGSGFGMGNLTFESADYDWTDYGRQVYMAIWRAWHQRLWMTTVGFEKWAHEHDEWLLNHQTQVRFVIERNGQVTGIVQEGASGCLPLDESALDALAEVILPPLPAEFPRGSEIVHARFIATAPVRDMRPALGRLKAMGQF